MAYPKQFIKFSFGGELPGGETWTNSLNLEYLFLDENNIVDDAMLDNWLNDMTLALETFYTAMDPYISGYTSLTWSKVAIIGTDGKYTRAPASRPIVGQSGGSGVNQMPNQVALVLSMQTDVWGKRAKNGRIYLAGLSMSLDDSGRIIVSEQQAIVGIFRKFIEDLNEAASRWVFPGHVVVASAVGAGQIEPVARVRVGRVLDTIRSRRTSQEEAYVSAELGSDTTESGV